MSESLSELLAGLTASDVEVDAYGRISVKDPEVARRLRALSEDVSILDRNSNCNHGCRTPQS